MADAPEPLDYAFPNTQIERLVPNEMPWLPRSGCGCLIMAAASIGLTLLIIFAVGIWQFSRLRMD